MHKNAQKVERKTKTNVKIAHLVDTFLEASPLEGQSLQQKGKERRKRKGPTKIPKIEKP